MLKLQFLKTSGPKCNFYQRSVFLDLCFFARRPEWHFVVSFRLKLKYENVSVEYCTLPKFVPRTTLKRRVFKLQVDKKIKDTGRKEAGRKKMIDILFSVYWVLFFNENASFSKVLLTIEKRRGKGTKEGNFSLHKLMLQPVVFYF